MFTAAAGTGTTLLLSLRKGSLVVFGCTCGGVVSRFYVPPRRVDCCAVCCVCAWMETPQHRVCVHGVAIFAEPKEKTVLSAWFLRVRVFPVILKLVVLSARPFSEPKGNDQQKRGTRYFKASISFFISSTSICSVLVHKKRGQRETTTENMQPFQRYIFETTRVAEQQQCRYSVLGTAPMKPRPCGIRGIQQHSRFKVSTMPASSYLAVQHHRRWLGPITAHLTPSTIVREIHTHVRPSALRRRLGMQLSHYMYPQSNFREKICGCCWTE